MSIVLGVIADDSTGATDIANTLVKRGMRVVQVIGVPDAQTQVGEAEAVVVALKSRTNPIGEAVDWSLQALSWLQAQGAEQIVFKYCSTFDSTPMGNIGPVADALQAALKTDMAFICPAFPANGRTIYQGHLFVFTDLLSDSSMKDHPLTPMHESSLVRHMAAQSVHAVGLIDLQTVRAGVAAIQQQVTQLKAEGKRYAVVDALDDHDLEVIGHAAAGHALVTGGSGVATGLPDNFRQQGKLADARESEMPALTGREVVLAGSCSQATREQIAYVQAQQWPHRRIDVDALAVDDNVVTDLLNWALAQPASQPILIYASSTPEQVKQVQARYGVHEAGAMVEGAMAKLAQGLVERGFRRLVVAGGETSGAVVSALQVNTLRIAGEIDPGVPWTESLGKQPLALALKSGNFGTERFFAKAFEVLA